MICLRKYWSICKTFPGYLYGFLVNASRRLTCLCSNRCLLKTHLFYLHETSVRHYVIVKHRDNAFLWIIYNSHSSSYMYSKWHLSWPYEAIENRKLDITVLNSNIIICRTQFVKQWVPHTISISNFSYFLLCRHNFTFC